MTSPTLSAVLTSVGDPDGTRTIVSIVALLGVLGLVLVMVAVWLFKTTRPDPELLAPLEVMGERKWRRGDPVWQRRRLDELRPDGAQPLEPSSAPPDVDEAFDRGPEAKGFDDLRDDDAAATSVGGIEVDEAALAAAEEKVAENEAEATEGVSSTPPDGVAVPPADLAARAEAAREALDDDAEAPGAPAGETSTGLDFDLFDDLPDHDIDPEILAAAMAELDAELAGKTDVDPSTDD